MPEFGATTELHGRVDGSLRVGAALDGPAVPAWISATLSGLYEADFLDVRIVALDVASLDLPRARASRWPTLLFTLYEKLDYRLFKSATDAFAHVEVIGDLTGRANVLTDLTDDSTLAAVRSEEHTSELQSHHDLVCRLLLEKKKKKIKNHLTQNKQKKK